MDNEEQIKTFRVTIVGIRPMLQHSPSGIGEKTGRSKDYDPIKEAESYLYKNKEGKISFPAINILSCIREAASDYKVAGKGKKTYKTYIYSGVSISPEMIPMENDGWEPDIRPCVIGTARVLRSRPKFDNWSLSFTLSRLDEIINVDDLRDIISAAGRYKGLGDFRPLFGLFEIKSFEPIT